jgi:hypothetical protein
LELLLDEDEGEPELEPASPPPLLLSVLLTAADFFFLVVDDAVSALAVLGALELIVLLLELGEVDELVVPP